MKTKLTLTQKVLLGFYLTILIVSIAMVVYEYYRLITY
jgi:CHASE3 domain sensor protein